MPDPRLPRGVMARRKTGVLSNALWPRLGLVALIALFFAVSRLARVVISPASVTAFVAVR